MTWIELLVVAFIVVMLAPLFLTLALKVFELFLATVEVVLYLLAYIVVGVMALCVVVWEKLTKKYRK